MEYCIWKYKTKKEKRNSQGQRFNIKEYMDGDNLYI